jgi:hypothetical protein
MITAAINVPGKKLTISTVAVSRDQRKTWRRLTEYIGRNNSGRGQFTQVQYEPRVRRLQKRHRLFPYIH